MNKKELWQTVLTELQFSLSKASFSSWFAKTKILNIKKIDSQRQIIEIGVINSFSKKRIEERYLGQVKEILDRITKIKNELVFIIKPQKIDFSLNNLKKSAPLLSFDYQKEKQTLTKQAIIKSGLNPAFTFKSFAVSSSNEVAYAAARAVAKKPGRAYRLLFLYGGVGVGKTHLMQAIGQEILTNNSEITLVYSSAEEFTNAIITAIKNKTTALFQKKYRSAKILLIDDIQFIGGKEKIQEEFFHTFNTINQEGGQIILTSDTLPDKIKGLEARLQSRFEGGLIIDIQQPTFELRTAILLIKASQWKKKLPIDVAKIIASNIKSTRKLEGFLIRLIAESKTKKQPITPQMAQKLLGKIINAPLKKEKFIRPATVLKTVANYFNLKTSEIKGIRRSKSIIFPRQIAMFLMRKELKIPFDQIGDFFNGRDHSTVMHSVNKIEKMIVFSSDLRNHLNLLKKNIWS